MENNNRDSNRILGRILAVDEIKDVSGARPTSPYWDQTATTYESDTFFLYDNPQP